MNRQTLQQLPPPLLAFCQKWKVSELSLFGSILRDDFRPDSDVDVLVSFEPKAPWTILDLVLMESELAGLVKRPADLIEKRAIEESLNPIRKAEILSTAVSIYPPRAEAA
ncbi:nucleotidyltransferase family protein [Synechococcus elongatus]|uniref:ANL30 n=1 Tax=Synechococcus elongatus (strain ATCC 33912 / PCC 7942 / FACHB-805) TaxID=1140 RepID=Q8KUV0_SYNE7|nr:nucleotidyltransferase domain-containing protein [Synechococcus elongatus]AAM81158.1 ANL30 [Synechococcus elongatus PCC 7942 = FACHB-805]ABB58644.1 conserved hypothetical protein [Synechococcus elongatus PCC 7942 = FACHB-805]AJD58955.1 hypothetical protein M744_14110 [Synechococcus elongatus UTEX 2973]MBD2589059.1 nucleotidyltransferase domain-containing protein [Synechococcus elongatus FACHB-242]MBD2690120.1 nucleotidyltransferase domain-containing protein [Synechococcus elongatus FACHB-10